MNPYSNLSDNAFWKTAVSSKNMFDIRDLWSPKFNLNRQHKISTFGSCFAQHIGNALLQRGFSWLNTEPEPFGLSAENCKRFNYRVFTCRTGNIYTTSLLRQWVEWALKIKTFPEEFWEQESRVFDPFRPNIEPNGFESKEEMFSSRQETIKSFFKSIELSNVFVFTLGLTESWVNQQQGYEYPMCPGTVAGEYNSGQHLFINQDYNLIKKNLLEAIKAMRKINPKLRFILTVSPVPLTATNSGKHVLVATMESKAILRAVAGELSRSMAFVDYFPSYEIINSPPFKGVFFEPNQRSVNHFGVDFVMDSFFRCLQDKYSQPEAKPPSNKVRNDLKKESKKSEEELVCEEQLLEAFGSNN